MAARAPLRPRLKETIDLFPASDGRVHLFRGGDSDYVIEHADERTRRLLALLDGTRELGEIERALGQGEGAGENGTRQAIEELAAAGLVEDAADDEVLTQTQRARYDRQLRYFGDCAPAGASRAEYQLRLSRATVVVLGLGGLGSWAALALAAAGVGRIVGLDGDVVEHSNLNRQVLFSHDDIGAPKAHAAARRLAAFNPELDFDGLERWLTSAEDVVSVVRGADFVVEAVDTPVHEIERWVNEACFTARVPYIAMSQFPPLVRVGPTFVPGVTGCYACQEEDWRERYPLFDEIARHRRGHPCPAASFGPASALIGGQVAMDVAHHVTRLAEPATLGASLTIDMRSFEVSREGVPKRDGCELCAA